MLVGLADEWGGVLDQRALKCSIENGFLVFQKYIHTLLFECSNGTRAEIHHALILVIHILRAHDDMFTLFCGQKAQHELSCLFEREKFEFVGILYVHDFIADVIGCFHKESERMTKPPLAFSS